MENGCKRLLQMVSIHRPLGYEPNTLPLRHGADVTLSVILTYKYNHTKTHTHTIVANLMYYALLTEYSLPS